MTTGMITPKRRRSQRQTLSVVVVVLYSLCTSLPGVFHAVVHAHETTVTHSVTQEQDPCHRMLYHGEAAACEHDAHLMDADKCSLCDVVCHVEQAIVTDVVALHAPYTPYYFECYTQRLDSYWAVLSSSRAPPACA
jgi:hypothetical protein